jgi:cytochrome c biogenesis protein CcmG, thiol:disulfide interchange protein DsbE
MLAIAVAGCGNGTAAASVGATAPPITGPAVGGGTIDLAAYRGRPVIVNFWASWCVPCRDELPLLRATEDAHRGEGLAIVGVLYKDDPAAAATFGRSMGVDWPSATDPSGAVAAAYRVVAPPQSYFVDRDGILRSQQIGELLQSDLDRQLPAILGQR